MATVNVFFPACLRTKLKSEAAGGVAELSNSNPIAQPIKRNFGKGNVRRMAIRRLKAPRYATGECQVAARKHHLSDTFYITLSRFLNHSAYY
jgi:hypothetical protein